MLTIPAYAKINLTLEVLARRSDGYHQISSVMQTVDLKDTLYFQLNKGLQLNCSIPELTSPDNLVIKAAKLLQATTNFDEGVSIYLEKGIPPASGLGGGSSDAAATLQALNMLWKLNLPIYRLMELASKLGSDVVFPLFGGTALAEGRGEKITPLSSFPDSWVVLLKPPIDLPNKTPRAYASLDPSHFTQGQFTQRMIDLLYQGEAILPSLCYNTFESVAHSLFPGLKHYQEIFLSAGAISVHLTGAGPTLFTLVESKSLGEGLYARLRSQGMEVYLAQTISEGRQDEAR